MYDNAKNEIQLNRNRVNFNLPSLTCLQKEETRHVKSSN